jgi:hypothetical protein
MAGFSIAVLSCWAGVMVGSTKWLQPLPAVRLDRMNFRAIAWEEMNTKHAPWVLWLAPAVLVMCGTPPQIEPPVANETSEDGGSDELGPAHGEDESGEGGAGELGANECLVEPVVGDYGYRHHCGGHMSFNFSGQANGYSLAKSYSYGFGPTYVDTELEDLDTYATPVVMACCGGPYNFDDIPSSQPTYFKNCKADAVQQMCSAMGQWLIKLAEEYPVAKDQLYDAAEVLGSKANQTDCLFSLYDDGENFNEISGTSWDIAVGSSSLTIEVELIEILEIAYAEPPAVCESVFENDQNLLPLLTQMSSGGLDVLALENGDITLTDNDAYQRAVMPTEGYMSVGTLEGGGVELRNLVLRDPSQITLVIDSVSYMVDSWNLALIGPVSGTARSSVTTFPAGAVSFSMSVSYGGVLYRAGGTNIRPFTLTYSGEDWRIAGLEVTFQDDATTWSLYNASTLVFAP